MVTLQTPKITLIFGKICSGKSTYADALCYTTKAKRITVSDIVKTVSGLSTRSGLQSTQHLDEAIGVELLKKIKAYDKVVIDGIRQVSIVEQILRAVKQEDVLMLWLEVPDQIREFRFHDRVMSKDDLTFQEADKRDEELGLLELRDTLKSRYITIQNH